jgi:mannitol/fructose-specific phosphotransferase system IIA component (Ntr-type)
MNLPKLCTLADYTKPELIIPQLTTRTTTSVMQELTTVLHREDGSAPDQRSSSTTALIRELLTGMALDFGAAFPHVRGAALSRPRFALGRSSEPLLWRASGFLPTELVFLILEPAKPDAEYGQLVRTLHSLGRDRLHLDGLRRATNVEEILAVLAQIPLVAASEQVRVPAVSPVPAHINPSPRAVSFRRWRH